MRIPDRGEIWHTNLNPTAGKEQQGCRPVLIISRKEFNRSGLALVCPITQGGHQSRFAGFHVSLMGLGTETLGIVMCNQPRTIDYSSRHAEFIETIPEHAIDEVLAKIQAILD